MSSYITLTPQGVTISGSLMKNGKRVQATLPHRRSFTVDAADRLVGHDGKFLVHDITWVEVNLDEAKVRVGTTHQGIWGWDGCPKYARFRAKGPVEKLVELAGGSVKDLKVIK